MNCKRCKKECLTSELKNGYCVECFQKYDGDMNELKNVGNAVANHLKTGTVWLAIIGMIISIISFANLSDTTIALGILIGSLTVAVFLRSISEIIQLLEDIKNK